MFWLVHFTLHGYPVFSNSPAPNFGFLCFPYYRSSLNCHFRRILRFREEPKSYFVISFPNDFTSSASCHKEFYENKCEKLKMSGIGASRILLLTFLMVALCSFQVVDSGKTQTYLFKVNTLPDRSLLIVGRLSIEDEVKKQLDTVHGSNCIVDQDCASVISFCYKENGKSCYDKLDGKKMEDCLV